MVLVGEVVVLVVPRELRPPETEADLQAAAAAGIVSVPGSQVSAAPAETVSLR